MTPSRKRARALVWAVVLAALVGWHVRTYLALVAQRSFEVAGVRYFTLGDDAMISMRYAHNLAAGRGLVWNAGERVEGITNLGWTLVMAAVHALRRPTPENGLYVQMLNLLLQVSTVVYVAFALRAGPAGAGLLAALLIAANGSMLCWGSSGSETSLQALICAIALVPLLLQADSDRSRRFPLAMGLLAVAFVVRPDGIVLLGSLALVGAWWRWTGAITPRSWWAGIALAAAAVAAVLAFQELYYGSWLPNTYYLKATGGAARYGRGLGYVAAFCVSELFQIGLVLGPFLLAAQRLRAGEPGGRILPPAFIVAAWLAYVVSVGGDAFQFGRFFVAVIPLLAAATAMFVASGLRGVPWRSGAPWSRSSTAALAPSVTVLLLLGPYLYLNPTVGRRIALNRGRIESVQLAVALRSKGLPTDALIAVFHAGTLPYFMPDHRFHDMLGKSDRRIAHSRAHAGPPGHNKWDFAYSIGELRPALIVTAGPFAGATDAEMARRAATGEDFGFHPELWIDPSFRQFYRPNRVELSIDGQPINQVLWVYARQDHPIAARAP